MSKKVNSDSVFEALSQGQERVVFDMLYKSCWPKVLKYIQKNSGDKPEAEDIFHDALIIFFKQVKQRMYDSAKDADGYVFVIARNLWINRAKKKNTQVEFTNTNIQSGEDIHSKLVSQEWEERVVQLMSVLGERCKELLILTIFHNLSLSEVREKMGFGSIDVVKTKHYKCKQRLIKEVKNHAGFKAYLRDE